ncbi:MAG: hemin uptake protein HemP [Pseudomonadota bacterium]
MVVNVPTQATARPLDQLPIYDANDLTQGGDLARIKLDDQVYTLRITRAGKLILTK